MASLANLAVDGMEFRSASKSLANALERVKILESMLPMCIACKKIKNDGERWVPFEEYLHEQSGTIVSHGVCPACAGEWTG